MKIFYTIVLLAIHSVTLGQGLDLLDNSSGFKGYKLGSKISVYQNELKYSGTSEGMASYEHVNPRKINFQNLDPKKAFFDFYEGELYDIMLYIDDYQAIGYNRVIRELELLFGEPTEIKETLTGNIWIAWEGEKTKLYTQYFTKDDLICIEIKSVTIERKILARRF